MNWNGKGSRVNGQVDVGQPLAPSVRLILLFFLEGEKGGGAALRPFSGLESGVRHGWRGGTRLERGGRFWVHTQGTEGNRVRGDEGWGLGFDEKDAGLDLRS